MRPGETGRDEGVPVYEVGFDAALLGESEDAREERAILGKFGGGETLGFGETLGDGKVVKRV